MKAIIQKKKGEAEFNWKERLTLTLITRKPEKKIERGLYVLLCTINWITVVNSFIKNKHLLVQLSGKKNELAGLIYRHNTKQPSMFFLSCATIPLNFLQTH